MRIIKKLTHQEFVTQFEEGNRVGTSFERRPTDDKEYMCVSCDRTFFVCAAKSLIFHSLCDDCFAQWNWRNIFVRMAGVGYEVPIEKNMHLWNREWAP